PITVEGSNASAQIVSSENAAPDDSVRVRVTNSADSNHDQFYVGWSDGRAVPDANDSVAFFVPAGTSRVLPVPRGANLLAD
ncbi:MAG: hypothetical protein GTO62_15635, partial [Planctomycetales bacterium]|nr:hypothetical protein [Planctomycetales bacterium]